MKLLLKLIAVVFIFSVMVEGAQAKTTIKATDAYTISYVDEAEAASNSLQTWMIAYGDENKNIEVHKNIIRNGEEYIVRHEFFEVRYVNTSSGFGVKRLRGNQQQVSTVIVNAVLCNTQLKQQQMLWNETLSEEKALDYIASFVPHLLNENYKYLLN